MQFDVLCEDTLSYKDGLALQLRLLTEIQNGERPSTLVFLQHTPVVTLGANFHQENLLLTLDELKSRGIDVHQTDRGGDVTYHGPGQLVVYPIFRLEEVGKDLHRWLRCLEEATILTLREFGVEGRRFPPHTGVWIGDKKAAAIGIKVKRWVSMHGIAINCSNSLDPFQLIVPCGIRDYGVTSLSEHLQREVRVDEVRPAVERAFHSIFSG